MPVKGTFDPVGSTATLVVERFRQSGMEPSRPTATMLLGAVLSDTVILNSATTTPRDHAVVDYLERVLALDAHTLGRDMFQSTADVSEISAQDIIKLMGPNTASYIQMSDQLGTLEAGKLADITIVDGNPLDGYWNMLRTKVVLKSGKVVVDKRK